MGWTYSSRWDTKEKIVNDLLADLRGNYTIVAYRSTRSGLWAVIEREGKRDIFFALIEKHQGEYGYKDMAESMHPYTYDCPLEFLGMAPIACQDWRNGVIAYWGRKASAKDLKRALKPGMLVKLQNKSIPQIRIVSVDGNTVAGEYEGRVYRITPRSLIGAVIDG